MITKEQQSEIDELRASTVITTRAVAPGAESVLHTAFPVLDHGFVRLVDYMGDDNAICQAARVSYGKGTKSVQNDEGLIRYLMRHWHSTPFEMCEIKLHVKLPIFVARQWIRHRTANVNEYSARYSIMDREFYIPAAEQMAMQSEINNQGRGQVLDTETALRVQQMLMQDAMTSYDTYEALIRSPDEGGTGLARELARMNLPANIYTQWYWKTDLHNLFHFLRLRQDPHAQYEIRAYADAIADEIVAAWVPMAYRAYQDYRQGAETLSAPAVGLLRAALASAAKGEKVTPDGFDLSGRELRELTARFPELGALIG